MGRRLDMFVPMTPSPGRLSGYFIRSPTRGSLATIRGNGPRGKLTGVLAPGVELRLMKSADGHSRRPARLRKITMEAFAKARICLPIAYWRWTRLRVNESGTIKQYTTTFS